MSEQAHLVDPMIITTPLQHSDLCILRQACRMGVYCTNSFSIRLRGVTVLLAVEERSPAGSYQ